MFIFRFTLTVARDYFAHQMQNQAHCLPPVPPQIWKNGYLDTCSREYTNLKQAEFLPQEQKPLTQYYSHCNRLRQQICSVDCLLCFHNSPTKIYFFLQRHKHLIKYTTLKRYSQSFAQQGPCTWAEQSTTTAGTIKPHSWKKSQK